MHISYTFSSYNDCLAAAVSAHASKPRFSKSWSKEIWIEKPCQWRDFKKYVYSMDYRWLTCWPGADESSEHVPDVKAPPLGVVLKVLADGVVQTFNGVVERALPLADVETTNFRRHVDFSSTNWVEHVSRRAATLTTTESGTFPLVFNSNWKVQEVNHQ